MEYDSVVFPARSTNSWYGEVFTEVVLLRWGREMGYVGHFLDQFRCGGPRAEHLRPCHPTDAAVRLHGPSCALPRAPEQLALTGCPYTERPDARSALAEAFPIPPPRIVMSDDVEANAPTSTNAIAEDTVGSLSGFDAYKQASEASNPTLIDTLRNIVWYSGDCSSSSRRGTPDMKKPRRPSWCHIVPQSPSSGA